MALSKRSLPSGEGNQAAGASLKGQLAAPNCLARLELPDLTFWNWPSEQILVTPHMLRLYRTPTVDPLVEKGYVHLLGFAHGRMIILTGAG